MDSKIKPRSLLASVSSNRKSEFLKLARQSRVFHQKWVQAPTNDEKFAEYLKRTRRKSSKSFFIIDYESKKLVGVINISQIVRGFFQSAFLGFYVFKPFANKGYMSAALNEAIAESFTKLKLHRLEANIQPTNEASKKVIQKVGFRLEGFSPRYLQVDGKWQDHERWALTIEDWKNPKNRKGNLCVTAV